jgi:type III restriction enzyme
MKLHFDPNQQFQLDAIAAVTDLFEGQPQSAPTFTPINVGDFGEIFAGQAQTELGMGNQILVDEEKLRNNTRNVQHRNDIEIADPAAALEAWELFDVPADKRRNCPHFSVEMETGTGKTYVYLRTIFELSQKYGFQKFIIVVPSVAIREGTLKNLEITEEHFKSIYNLTPEYFVYDAKKINRLRQFAVSNTLQVLVINIDAFRKNFIGTEEEKKSNVIYKESDRLSGRPPIEFV